MTIENYCNCKHLKSPKEYLGQKYVSCKTCHKEIEDKYWYKEIEVDIYFALLEKTEKIRIKYEKDGWEFLGKEYGPDEPNNGYNPNYISLYFRKLIK